MDNYRLILIVSLLFIGMMIWSSWQNDYHMANTQVGSNTVSQMPSEVPAANIEPLGKTSVQDSAQFSSLDAASDLITIETDVLNLSLDTRGASIVEIKLLKYALSPDEEEIPFKLMSDSNDNYFIAQSGLLGDSDNPLPNHKSIYGTSKKIYRLDDSENSLDVTFTWSSDNISVNKTYSFTRGSYEVRLTHEVINNSEKVLPVRDYRQFIRSKPTESSDSFFIYTYTGGAIYSPEDKFSKISFDDLSSNTLSKSVTGGWIAMMQHYFLGAFIPDSDQPQHFYSKKLSDNKFILGMYSQSQNLNHNDKARFTGRIWLGPKLQDKLESTAVGLDLTTDYGWLTVIAKPLFWILKTIHDFIGNWGWSIVILTILIKLAFYKLSATSYKSMAGMRKLAPRLQQIKERYGDDKEKFNKAMMELYQKEKINPVSGCLPILVQIPVFIALYWVLLESVELRDAPFILWIDNLSVKDPYFILPLIMGVSMYVQQKLNPQPPDPLQAKIMMSLPFIFTIFFAFFPSGLVLYWVVNNLLSILQQWHITKKIEEKSS